MNVLKWIRILALATVAPFAIAASAADAAPLRYEIVDYFDEIKLDPDGNPMLDPDGNPIPGEPLDKGFAVTGTITANGLGFYDDSEFDLRDPFQSWNIAETVRKADMPDVTYNFTQANSSWALDQNSFIPGLPVVEITEDFIFLLQTNISGDTADNSLILQNPGENQQFFYNVSSGGTSDLFASATISEPLDFNGIYGNFGAGRIAIGRRIPAVPVPAPLGLLAAGVILLGCVGVRRGGRA